MTENTTTETTVTETTEQPAGKTFTQDDVNRIVADRVARTQQKFADYDQLKSAAAELDKVRDASRSDLERAVEAARKEGAQVATQAANSRLVKAEARALAAGAKFRDPSDAVAFLGDLSSVKVTADGDVDTASLEKALADLAKAKPYLLAEEPPTRPVGDPGQGPRDSAPASHGALMNDLIRATRG
jgi:hypothetical protein